MLWKYGIINQIFLCIFCRCQTVKSDPNFVIAIVGCRVSHLRSAGSEHLRVGSLVCSFRLEWFCCYLKVVFKIYIEKERNVINCRFQWCVFMLWTEWVSVRMTRNVSRSPVTSWHEPFDTNNRWQMIPFFSCLLFRDWVCVQRIWSEEKAMW